MVGCQKDKPGKQSGNQCPAFARRPSKDHFQQTTGEHSGALVKETSLETIKQTFMSSSQEDIPGKQSSEHSCAPSKRVPGNQLSGYPWLAVKWTTLGQKPSDHSCAPSKQTSLRSHQANIHGKQSRGPHSCATVKTDKQAIPGKQSVNLY